MQTIPFPVELLDAPHYHAIRAEIGGLGQAFYLHLCLLSYDSNGNLGACGPKELAILAGFGGTSVADTLFNGLVAAGAITLNDDGTVAITNYNQWFPATTPAAEAARCPVRKIIELYHLHLPMLPQARAVSATTEGYIRARWREQPERQSLEWWEDYFKYVATRPFLIGEAEARPGRRPFQATLQWIVRPTNMEKIINGNYDP